MTPIRRRLFLLALPLGLAACAEPMIPDSDVIRHATEPAFGYDARGQIQPTSCREDRPSTYSGTPSACARDVVFARQVANPGDLVDPRRPGPAPAAPLGRAADAYLTGGRLGRGPAMIVGTPSRPASVAMPATAGMGDGGVYYAR